MSHLIVPAYPYSCLLSRTKLSRFEGVAVEKVYFRYGLNVLENLVSIINDKSMFGIYSKDLFLGVERNSAQRYFLFSFWKIIK